MRNLDHVIPLIPCAQILHLARHSGRHVLCITQRRGGPFCLAQGDGGMRAERSDKSSSPTSKAGTDRFSTARSTSRVTAAWSPASQNLQIGKKNPEAKTRTKELRCKVIAMTRILTGYHRERDHRRRRLWTCGGFAVVAGSAVSERVATLPAASGPDGIITAGPVMAIGGAEDKLRDKLILSAFVNLAGGPDARVAIVPTASSIEEAGERYKALFLGMGAETRGRALSAGPRRGRFSRGRRRSWTT